MFGDTTSQAPTLAQDKQWHEAAAQRVERISQLWRAAAALKPSRDTFIRHKLPLWIWSRVWTAATTQGALVVREPYRHASEAVIMMRLEHFEELLLAVDDEARKAAAQRIPSDWTWDQD